MVEYYRVEHINANDSNTEWDDFSLVDRFQTIEEARERVALLQSVPFYSSCEYRIVDEVGTRIEFSSGLAVSLSEG